MCQLGLCHGSKHMLVTLKQDNRCSNEENTCMDQYQETVRQETRHRATKLGLNPRNAS